MQRVIVLTWAVIVCCAAKLNAQQHINVNWVDKVFDSIVVYNDYPFSTVQDFNGENVQLKMNIYAPKCPRGSQAIDKLPLMLVVHGGSFLAGSKDEPSIVRYCMDFAQRGYITASIDYRLGFVNSSGLHQCNFPNYNCFFAADSAEWYRALFRGIQDVNDAVYFLLNEFQFPTILYPEHGTYWQQSIDDENVFLVGESAGAFIVLGAALMDSTIEKFAEAFAIDSVAKPNSNTLACAHNNGKNFPAKIARPDLGEIRGNKTRIPNERAFIIKGVGNMFGGTMKDLMAIHNPSKPQPAIFSYHRPCDLVVPIDENSVYWGINWCLTNGYGCSAINKVPKVLGSRALSKRNTLNGLGYQIQNHFTSDTFDFQYLFGQYSCVNQTNQACHGYDNRTLRDSLLATFFSSYVSTSTVQTYLEMVGLNDDSKMHRISVQPNPFNDYLEVENLEHLTTSYKLVSLTGIQLQSGFLERGKQILNFDGNIASGIYLFQTHNERGFSSQKLLRFQ